MARMRDPRTPDEADVLRRLSTLDRFLPLWIALAMAGGLVLGSLIPGIRDLLASRNAASTFPCLSVSGNAVWLAGQATLQYQVGPNGGIPIAGLTGTQFGSATAGSVLRSIVTADRAHLIERELNRVTARSIDAQAAFCSLVAARRSARISSRARVTSRRACSAAWRSSRAAGRLPS